VAAAWAQGPCRSSQAAAAAPAPPPEQHTQARRREQNPRATQRTQVLFVIRSAHSKRPWICDERARERKREREKICAQVTSTTTTTTVLALPLPQRRSTRAAVHPEPGPRRATSRWPPCSRTSAPAQATRRRPPLRPRRHPWRPPRRRPWRRRRRRRPRGGGRPLAGARASHWGSCPAGVVRVLRGPVRRRGRRRRARLPVGARGAHRDTAGPRRHRRGQSSRPSSRRRRGGTRRRRGGKKRARKRSPEPFFRRATGGKGVEFHRENRGNLILGTQSTAAGTATWRGYVGVLLWREV